MMSAGIKISQLPAIPSSALTDVLPEVQPASGGTTYKATLNQIMTLFENNIVITDANFSGVLHLDHGGLQANITADNGGIFYSNATTGALLASTATAGQILQSGSHAAPSWSIPTYPSVSGTAGKFLQSDGTNIVYSSATFPVTPGVAGSVVISDGTNFIDSTILFTNTVGSAGKILRSNGTTNIYSTSTFADTYAINTLLYASGANTVTGLATATTAVLTTSSGVPTWASTLSLALGGTNASLTASNGGIFYSTASAGAILSGTATASLPLLSGSSTAPTWGAFALSLGGALTTAGAITTVGAFGVTFTFTNTTAVTFPTSGTLATTSQLQGLTWVAASSTPITAVVNTGYYITDASQVTITCPTTAAAGSLIAVVGTGAGGWVLQPGSGQTIKVIGSSASTSITSTGQYDSIEIICTVANTTWVARSLLSTGLTIV